MTTESKQADDFASLLERHPLPWRAEVIEDFGAIVADAGGDHVFVLHQTQRDVARFIVSRVNALPAHQRMREACERFLNAPRSEHLVTRLNDEEAAAVEAMRSALSNLTGSET